MAVLLADLRRDRPYIGVPSRRVVRVLLPAFACLWWA